ncbi:hypothetical protein [Paractinoplanes maris]|uniref:hypothetical protein n=1 Tax=Paractinoplanes maris TaxID=1734446 RepID=UPI002020C50B|nr:hypothetical protein [Actinoplanes maris]
MDAALSRRLASLFMDAAASTEERELLVSAAEQVSTFEALPSDAKALIAELEARAATIKANAERAEPDVRAAAGDSDAQRLQAQWDAAKARLLRRWPKLAGPMVEELAAQAEAAIEAGDLAALGELEASAAVVAAVAVPLRKSGTDLAKEAAAGVVEEAAAQDVSITAPDQPGAERVRQHADAVARIIANGYAAGAARTALQLAGAGPQDVRDEVERHLTELGTSEKGMVADNIGSLLSAAQFAGRLAVLEENPAKSYRASETLDLNTCPPCRETDGKEFRTLRAALAVYPLSGSHRSCEGRARCRGFIQPTF